MTSHICLCITFKFLLKNAETYRFTEEEEKKNVCQRTENIRYIFHEYQGKLQDLSVGCPVGGKLSD